MKTIQEIAKERAEVMLHFANGGDVEFKARSGGESAGSDS